MKTTNINPIKLYHVTTGALPITTPVGKAMTPHGVYLTAFVATHYVTGAILRSADGERVRLNWIR